MPTGDEKNCPWDDADAQKCTGCKEASYKIKAHDLPLPMDMDRDLKPGDRVLFLPDETIGHRAGDYGSIGTVFSVGDEEVVCRDWSAGLRSGPAYIEDLRVLSPAINAQKGHVVKIRSDAEERENATNPTFKRFPIAFCLIDNLKRAKEEIHIVKSVGKHGKDDYVSLEEFEGTNWSFVPDALEYVVDEDSLLIEEEEEDELSYPRIALEDLRKKMHDTLFKVFSARVSDAQLIDTVREYVKCAVDSDGLREVVHSLTGESCPDNATAAKHLKKFKEMYSLDAVELCLVKERGLKLDVLMGGPSFHWQDRVERLAHFITTSSHRTDKFELNCEAGIPTEKPKLEEKAVEEPTRPALVCEECGDGNHHPTKGRLMTNILYEGFYHAQCLQNLFEEEAGERKLEESSQFRNTIWRWTLRVAATTPLIAGAWAAYRCVF